MTDVEFTPLDTDPPAQPAATGGDTDLTRLTDVTVELTVEVGRTHMSLGETMSLGQGSVVTLDRLADKPVDLLVNGRPIARGEVVVIDEQFGLRITEVNGAEHAATAAPVSFAPAELPPGDPPALPEAA
jgi:flagellar motor switch protein FliN